MFVLPYYNLKFTLFNLLLMRTSFFRILFLHLLLLRVIASLCFIKTYSLLIRNLTFRSFSSRFFINLFHVDNLSCQLFEFFHGPWSFSLFFCLFWIILLFLLEHEFLGLPWIILIICLLKIISIVRRNSILFWLLKNFHWVMLGYLSSLLLLLYLFKIDHDVID